MTDDAVFYDAATDSLYVKIRPGESVRQREDAARDLVIDLDADGAPVGYEIQGASRQPQAIAEALSLLQAHRRAAA
jgi:uncharacterized protein YuzE